MFDISATDQVNLTQFLRDLVRTPSVSCHEQAVAARIADEMRAVGIQDVAIDRIGNVIARIRGAGRGPTLLFDGHMDTVGISDPSTWTHDPLGAEVEDGKLYGLGACDMKGSLAAMVYAAKLLIDRRVPLYGDVLLACVVQEEPCEGLGARVMIEEEGISPDWVVLCEPSNLHVTRGQRGRIELEVSTHGRTCHASQPEAGDNAIYNAVRVIFGVELLAGNLAHDRFLGSGTLAITHIESQAGSRNAVPDICRFIVDRRLTLGETEGRAITELQSIIAREGVRAEVGVTYYEATSYNGYVSRVRNVFPAWVTEESHPLVQAAVQAVRDELGVRPKIGKWAFSTDGVYTAGVAGIPTVGLGPGDDRLAHTADEHITLDQVSAAARAYARLAALMLGGTRKV